MNDSASIQAPSTSESLSSLQGIDILFDKTYDMSLWAPARPPQALGELLDSRFMIPLLFPSDPRFLAALPGKQALPVDDKRTSIQSFSSSSDRHSIRSSTASKPLPWRSRHRKVRQIDVRTLDRMDGARPTGRWGRAVVQPDDGDEKPVLHVEQLEDATIHLNTQATPLTRKPSSGKSKRQSIELTTPIDVSCSHSQFPLNAH
jgi:hypothetical protein